MQTTFDTQLENLVESSKIDSGHFDRKKSLDKKNLL